ncbi:MULTISPECIES: HK97-gp10 family putative phage morphogenesis protein [Brevibacillus]|uniref:HK97-gp10 family putative phage morphogenesis protein n=1 Tax=Brevibacillus TaxID=55080 RepID=UPI0004F3D47B|nr:HK97-gp10 family putative phage morphogenesis protein [Brevibacillus borstelensis]KKX52567.1 hypothetical protein X546_24470 [Brevibacillus borstelensis cifa_chp40]
MAGFDTLFRALNSIPKEVDAATKRGLKRGAAKVMKKAKEKLGSYQSESGPYPSWKHLKPETVARKYTVKSGPNKGFFNKKGLKLLRQPGGWRVGSSADAPLVDSGQLRQAITTDDSDLKSEGVMYVGVASGAGENGNGGPGDYAAAHEFGSGPKNIPARPFLRPALYESQDEIKEAVTTELLKGLRRL